MKPSKFTAKDKLMFKRLGITPKLIEDAGIRRVTNLEARGCGIKADPQRDMAGLLIPYLNPETGDQEAFRLRRDHPETKDGKPQGKYMCPPKSKRALFFPPYSAGMLEDLSIPVVMVESEKAAMALRAWSQRTKNTILPVAMGGCFGYRVNNGPGKKSTTVDDLKVCNGRNVIIMLDTNVATNPQVQAARDALTKELLNRRSSVFLATLPQVDGVNGPDDLLALKGGDERMKVILAEAAVPPTAPNSDDMLAKRFTKKQGSDWRFVATQGRWFHWNEQHWKRDDTKQIVDEIRLVCREAASECLLKSEAQRVSSAKTISAVEYLLKPDRQHAADVDQWDSDLWILNTPRGVVELRSGRIRHAKREDYCTKITKVSPGGKCPQWRNFLNEITGGNRSLQRYLQRVGGYVLTGATDEHAMFFLFGLGANGKSVFVNTLSGLLGDYARPAPIATFTFKRNENHPTDIAGLHGARLVTVTETQEGGFWDEAKIKLMTGGDPVSARYMRQDYFDFTPRFKLIVCGNHRPSLRTVDEAMRRRLNLIPFTVQVAKEKQDKGLAEKFKSEWPGILSWAIEGCRDWQRRGLDPPQIVTAATTEYLAEEDTLGLWMAECVVRDLNMNESPADLFRHFKSWAQAKGLHHGEIKKFSQNLVERGVERGKAGGNRYFRGIKLRGWQEVADDPVVPVDQKRQKFRVIPITTRPAPSRPSTTHAKSRSRHSNRS